MMMRKTFSSRWVVCVCIAVMGSTTAFGNLVNGDFSITDPLHGDFGWDPPIGVEVGTGKATFLEDPPLGPDLMTLSQDVTLGAGNYILSYDISFISTAKADTDVLEVLWDSTPLLSMNNKGVDDYTSEGLTEYDDSDPETVWWYGTVEHPIAISNPSGEQHLLKFSLSLDNEDPPEFTIVTIDNVKIVPLPGSVLLGGLGLAIANWRLKRRRAV